MENKWIHAFPKGIDQRELPSALFRILTLVTNYISYDNNPYAKHTFLSGNKCNIILTKTGLSFLRIMTFLLK